MSPEAAQYVRSRQWMTSKLMQKWGVGWIPGSGRYVARTTWSTPGEQGEVNASYSDRDLNFEKWQQWVKDGKPEGKKPNKHYVRLLGPQTLQASPRLNETYVPRIADKIRLSHHEGMNDVITGRPQRCRRRPHHSRATDHQSDPHRFAQQTSNFASPLFPDSMKKAKPGSSLLWKLANVTCVQLACSSQISQTTAFRECNQTDSLADH
ncbi:MAG: hypothetical protein R3C12_21620 [Planctomycetaceae bacterium]